MSRGAQHYRKVDQHTLANAARPGDTLLSAGHGPLKIVRFEHIGLGTCCVVCKTRGGDEIDLSAEYARAPGGAVMPANILILLWLWPLLWLPT